MVLVLNIRYCVSECASVRFVRFLATCKTVNRYCITNNFLSLRQIRSFRWCDELASIEPFIQSSNSPLSYAIAAHFEQWHPVHYYSISFADQMLLCSSILAASLFSLSLFHVLQLSAAPFACLLLYLLNVIRRATTQFSYTNDSLLFSTVATVFIQIIRWMFSFR